MVSLFFRDFLKMQNRAWKWKGESLNDHPNEESVKYDPDIMAQSNVWYTTWCVCVCMSEIKITSKGMEGLYCGLKSFGVDQSSTHLLWDFSILVSSEEWVHTTLVVGWLNKMQDWEILCLPYEITASEAVYMLFIPCLYCTVFKLIEHLLFGKVKYRFCNCKWV